MIAVLGLGSIGMRHTGNALALGKAVIGFDPSPERRHLAQAAGATVTDDRKAALERAQAVVVATPSATHFDDLADCIALGRHVLVEKPLTHRSDGLEGLLRQAADTRTTVMVAMMLRLHPAVMRAHAILTKGGIGHVLWARFLAALYLPDWRPGQDWTQGYANDPRTGGALFDYIHEIDLATHLLGPARPLACVAGHSGSIGLQAEDMADLILAHPGNVNSVLHVDYVTRPRQRFAEIAGTKGFLRLNLDRRSLHWHDGTGTLVEETDFPGTYSDDYVAEMVAFLAAIDGDAPPPCDGFQALDVLECLISARTLAGLPS